MRIPRRGLGHVVMVMADRPGQLGKIGTALGVFGVNIEHVDLSGRSGDRVVLELALRLPPRVSRDELLMALGEVEGVEEVRWEDANAAA